MSFAIIQKPQKITYKKLLKINKIITQMVLKILDINDIINFNKNFNFKINHTLENINFIETNLNLEEKLFAYISKIYLNILFLGFHDAKNLLLTSMNSKDDVTITFLTNDFNFYIKSLQYNDQNVEIILNKDNSKKYLDHVFENEKYNKKVFFEYFDKIETLNIILKKNYDLVFINYRLYLEDFFKKTNYCNLFNGINTIVFKIEDVRLQKNFLEVFKKEKTYKIKDCNLFILKN